MAIPDETFHSQGISVKKITLPDDSLNSAKNLIVGPLAVAPQPNRGAASAAEPVDN